MAVYWRSIPPREVETYLFTARRGERGWSGSKEEYPRVRVLGKIRQAGLQAAAKLLGIHQIDFLKYLYGELDQTRSHSSYFWNRRTERETGICGQTLPPAADKVWEKPHNFTARPRKSTQLAVPGRVVRA